MVYIFFTFLIVYLTRVPQICRCAVDIKEKKKKMIHLNILNDEILLSSFISLQLNTHDNNKTNANITTSTAHHLITIIITECCCFIEYFLPFNFISFLSDMRPGPAHQKNSKTCHQTVQLFLMLWHVSHREGRGELWAPVMCFRMKPKHKNSLVKNKRDVDQAKTNTYFAGEKVERECLPWGKE